MKIGIVCYPSIGGSGLVATELGLSLAERGHEVHFISYETPFKLTGYVPNVHFHQVDPVNYPLFHQTLYTFSLCSKIIEVATEANLDIVHAHYSIPHSLCAHLAREISGLNFKIVTTLHGTDVTIVGQDRPLYPINKFGIEKSDMVTTVSQFQRQYTRENLGITHDIEVIYNFIDPEQFKPQPERQRCLCRDNELMVMHISNFRELKNPIGVIKTFAKVAAAVPEAKLVLIGDGPEITTVRKLCKQEHLCNRINFLGSLDNVETVLPMADVVLQPSYRESFGMVLLEAMACGVATVSSNVDGIPEVVMQGETGYHADPDDHEMLAKHTIDILQDCMLRKSLGQNGRRRAVEVFHADQIVPQYEDCYRRVLGM